MSRIAAEGSPYLQQHADNPVDWWPWCDEAFDEARKRDVPIFLSIGYSTCHWCHVMAHESFEDDEVAAKLNEAFVCIKLDREERPDLDSVYMAYCQMTTGSGGWPLTVMLDHARRPWFAGTYFPKHGRGGRPGMMELVPHMSKAWVEQRTQIEEGGEHVVAHLEQAQAAGDEMPEPTALLRGVSEQLAGRFDAEHGGFGQAPKFPSPHQLLALMRTGGDAELRAVGDTLLAMCRGGLHDHVGGGFHRYSTDRNWHLPHFEKMLYDQAMMLMALTEYWQATGNEEVARAARRLITYVERDLRLEDGAFASAEDADSAPPGEPTGHKEEGLFYIWSADQLSNLVQDPAGFMEAFDCHPEGNFNDESTGKPDPRNILHATRDPSWADTDLDALLATRQTRPRPLRDDKILADWNGLMVAALARASVLDDRALRLAEGAAGFVWRKMRVDGSLRHRWHRGLVDGHAFLDDHAFVAWGLFELWQATQHPDWFEAAQQAAAPLLEATSPNGALWPAPASDDLIARRIDAYDGAIPSGNSVAAWVAAKWWRVTGDTKWRDLTEGIGKAFSHHLSRTPSAFCAMVCGLNNLEGVDVVVPSDGGEWMAAARSGFAPDRIIIQVFPGIEASMPWLAGHPEGATVCQDHACSAPLTTPEALAKRLAAE